MGLEIDQPVHGVPLLRRIRWNVCRKSVELELLEIKQQSGRRVSTGMRKPVRDAGDGALLFLTAQRLVGLEAIHAQQPLPAVALLLEKRREPQRPPLTLD